MVNHFLTDDDWTACREYGGQLAAAISVDQWDIVSCPDCLETRTIDANACTCLERVMIHRDGTHDRSCPSFRPARRRTSCAGCDCEPGTTCDTRIRCQGCTGSKTACDANRQIVGDRCCAACDH